MQNFCRIFIILDQFWTVFYDEIDKKSWKKSKFRKNRIFRADGFVSSIYSRGTKSKLAILICVKTRTKFLHFFKIWKIEISMKFHFRVTLYWNFYRIWDKDPAENRNFRNITILKSRYLEDYWTDFENFGCFWKMRSSTCQKTELERLARSFSKFSTRVKLVIFRKSAFSPPALECEKEIKLYKMMIKHKLY